MNKNLLRWALPAFMLFITACNKTDFPKPPEIKPAQGLYVLNEGGFGANNASLGYYDFATKTYADLFEKTNNMKLGDVANDALIYGGKMYIVVNNSGVLMIANAATGKLVGSVDFKKADNTNSQPRNIVAHNGKVYVSTWHDGIKVVDTSSLKISQTINVRSGAEGMAIKNNQLYAAVGGSFASNYDSVISVVNLSTGTVSKNIVVGYNPVGKLYIDAFDNAYVYIYGKVDETWTPTGNGFVKVNLGTGKVDKKAEGSFGRILLAGKKIFALGGYSGFTTVKVYDAADLSQTSENFITDGTTLIRPYGIDIDEKNGDVYVTDAKDYKTSGKVYAFDKNGKQKYQFDVKGGINPSGVLFKR